MEQSEKAEDTEPEEDEMEEEDDLGEEDIDDDVSASSEMVSLLMSKRVAWLASFVVDNLTYI